MDKQKEDFQKNVAYLLENRQITLAEDCINEFAKMFPDSIENYSLQAGLCWAKGEVEKARQVICGGLQQNPYHPDLLQNLSVIASALPEKRKEAIISYSLLRMLSGESYDDLLRLLVIQKDKPLKVLQGTIEIANQMNTLTQSLNHLECSAKAVNYYPSYLKYVEETPKFITDSLSVEELNLACKKFAAEQIADHDIFHFHFGTSLTFDFSDLPVLVDMGKARLMHYWGSEIRRLSIARRHNPYVKVKETNENKILQQIQFVSQYIDECIVCDHELAQYVKGFFKKVHLLPLAVNLEKFQTDIYSTDHQKITIVHAPTNFEVKGTDVIVRVIEKLSNEFRIDFKLIQGMAHKEAMKMYQKADIVIDQIRIGCYGVFALECMAMGKPVVCWISDFMKSQYPSDLPIISANPDTLEKVLRDTLKNRDKLIEIGKQGRRYAEKYHDAVKVGNHLMGLYRNILR